MKPVKIVVVDTETFFLEGLSIILRRTFQTDCVVCGQSVSEVLRDNPELGTPDILMIGKDKLVPNLVDAIKKSNELLPNTKIVVMLSQQDGEDPVELLKNGASSCLSKTVETIDLLASLQLIISGRVIVSNCFAEKFFKTLSKTRTYNRKKEILSKREVEITKLVAHGKTNKEISRALCVTENTVKVHMKHILSKVKCKNRQQLVAFALLGKSLSIREAIIT